ncbi:MAG: flavodoxin family protein [candidate division WS1 bacterium]|jgi:multimeric flavodoxin WrbA|nr:flavodoxin family protein [candidate division WS1 bacterium]
MPDITVVALCGSPRRGGNTELMTDAFLEGAQSEGAVVEKFFLDEMDIRPIGPVGDVFEEREDVRADDDARMVLERMAAADIVVYASPVYWQGVSAQLKCLIDRQSAYYMAPWLREGMKGCGIFVITAYGAPTEDQSHWVIEPVKFWARNFGAKYLGEIAVNAAKLGQVAQMPGVLDEAREKGAAAVREMCGGR